MREFACNYKEKKYFHWVSESHWDYLGLMNEHQWTHQWSVLRLGGAVQSFRGLGGRRHERPLKDSRIFSAATADILSRIVGLMSVKVEERSHCWTALWLDKMLQGRRMLEKCQRPEDTSRVSDGLLWADGIRCKDLWEDELEILSRKCRNIILDMFYD